MLTDFFADTRYAFRMLIQQPWLSAAVTLTLAIGIGATTAVYTLVDSVLLRPLPVELPDRLVFGYGSFPLNDSASISPPDFIDYRDRSTSFEALAAMSTVMGDVAVGGADAPEKVALREASSELFRALGVAPALGRGFSADEAAAGGAAVAMLSDGFWRRRFAADPGIVGSEILVDERRTTVVGVLPGGFNLFGGADIWLPLRFGAEDMSVRRFHSLRVIGLLREDIDVVAAQAEIDAIAGELAEAHPESNTDWTMRLVPLHDVIVGPVRQPLVLILSAVAAVLFIGCCNVAILLLARATQRLPEMAMRNALGASGGRIVRLLLTESLLLALFGGGLGIALAYRGVGLLLAMSATALPRVDEIAVDGSVLAFCLAVSLGTGLLFGLAPAVRSTRRDLAAALRSHGQLAGRRSHGLRGALVVAQVALSFALLVGAGLMIRSLDALLRVEPGYAVDEIVAASIELPDTRYESAEQRAVFFDELLARLVAMPAVDGAGGIDIMPLTSVNDTYAYPEGSPPEPGTQGFNAQARSVTPGYFEAARIPLLEGRSFSGGDVAGGNPVVIIDETFAADIFPDGDPVGKRIVVDLGEPRPSEVVGVVGGVLHWGPSRGLDGTMYFPADQRPQSGLDVMVRTRGDPAAAITALRTAVGELDPRLPVGDVREMNDMMSGSVAAPRFRARILGAFAGAALLLAAGGLYAVLAYFVAERRREVGVRMALGADAGGVVRLVVRRGMKLVAVGLVAGAIVSVGMGWTIRSLLFEVSATDPVSFAGVAVALLIVALAACLLPARRATRVDPMVALRAE